MSRLKKVAATAAITIPTKYQNEQNSKLARSRGGRTGCERILTLHLGMYLEQIRKKYLPQFQVQGDSAAAQKIDE